MFRTPTRTRRQFFKTTQIRGIRATTTADEKHGILEELGKFGLCFALGTNTSLEAVPYEYQLHGIYISTAQPVAMRINQPQHGSLIKIRSFEPRAVEYRVSSTMTNEDVSIAGKQNGNEAEEEEEEDYMSMAIIESTAPQQKETLAQIRMRKKREAELRSRPKSKAELAASAAATRDAALSTALPTTTSKGFQMMAKLGFTPGSTLGAATNPHARLEPLGLEVMEGREGIGLASEQKRKFRAEVEGEAKRRKAEEGDYRERVAREREEARLEALVGAAMRTAESLDEAYAAAEGTAGKQGEEKSGDLTAKRKEAKTPLKQVNLLWRGLVRQRAEKERDRRMRYDLTQSLSRNNRYDDSNEDEHDRQAMGVVETELDEEDPELEDFLALTPAARLAKLVEYLRSNFWYCFWCKFRYPEAQMDGCPGILEGDHD